MVSFEKENYIYSINFDSNNLLLINPFIDNYSFNYLKMKYLI